eukprot:6182283-Pleurochrysis_carterae.AAC.3
MKQSVDSKGAARTPQLHVGQGRVALERPCQRLTALDAYVHACARHWDRHVHRCAKEREQSTRDACMTQA